MLSAGAYLGLFLSAFGAATLLPLQSESVLVALLLSWLPIVGDPLTLVAGVMRERLWVFLLIVGLAKTARYSVLAVLTLGWGAFVAP